MIPEEAMAAAKEAMQCVTPPPGVSKTDWLAEHGSWALLAGAISAAAPFIRAQALAEVAPLIRDLTDPDDCWFDHHGGCQAHGYLSLEPGQTCPQHDAKEFTRAVTERGGE